MSREISLEAAQELVDNYIDVFTDEELASYMDAAIDSSAGMAMLVWSAVGSRDQEVKINKDRVVALHKNMNTMKFVNILNSGNSEIKDYRYVLNDEVAVGEVIDGSLVLEPFQNGKTTVFKNGSVQGLLPVCSELK